MVSDVLLKSVALAVSRVLGEGSLRLADFELDFLTVQDGSVVLAEVLAVVVEVVVSERVSIDNNNAVLDECVGTDELVVGCVVDDVQDTSTARDT